MVDGVERHCGWCRRGALEAAALRSCSRHPQCTKAVREHRAALFPTKSSATPVDPKVRCCTICGKRGGMGSTTILRLLGYAVPTGAIGYAHADCIVKARATA